MKKKYIMNVFGCQMNERDAEIISGYLHEMGYQETENLADANLVVINTCAVRQKAEAKVFGKLGALKKYKLEDPERIIVVAGCMTQQEDVGEKIKKRYPYVDMVIGTHNLNTFPRLLDIALASRKTVVDVWDEAGPVVEGLPGYRKGTLKAWVNITYGCNNFCSYCIVPYVRGRERSRRMPDIIGEVEELSKQGFVEITLLGQNVNSYGKDLEGDVTFAGLLLALEEIEGIERVRYMTSHPRDFTPELVDIIKGTKKVCEHFHLPVQSGSNGILKAMNRGYTREHYLEIIAKIRREVPKASITTDIIVGFPGETEEDFMQTLDMLERVKFDAAFTFLYSPRTGTPAEKLPDQVPEETKKERIYRLIEKQNAHSLAINKALIGQRVDVLVEDRSKTDEKQLTGTTRTYKLVNFPGDTHLVGKIIPVSITDAQTWSLTGKR